MRVLGIDPGYGRMGVALVETRSTKSEARNGEPVLLHSDCLETSAGEFDERLGELMARLETLTKLWKPDRLALERLFFNTNQKTAMRVAEVRGAVIALSQRLGLETREYTPQEVKVAVTGYGKAAKKDVASMLKKLLGVKKVVKHDDEYDAMAVALTSIVSR
ncbi:MAG TPA: crossover junction endodeoxyribonuclease RuvC [Candidatus Paceibacterota bacterium]